MRATSLTRHKTDIIIGCDVIYKDRNNWISLRIVSVNNLCNAHNKNNLNQKTLTKLREPDNNLPYGHDNNVMSTSFFIREY